MRRLLLVLALVALAAAFIVPWVVGGEVGAHYRDALAEFPARGLRVTDERLERGWFSSSAITELIADPRPGQAAQAQGIRFRVASRFYHGPWHLATPRLLPVAAVVESRVEALLPELELPPLFLTTVVGLDGAGATRLRLPPVERRAGPGNAGVRSAEGSGEVLFQRGFSTLEGRFELPSIEFAPDGDTRFLLEGLRSAQSGFRRSDGLIVGEGELRFDLLTVTSPTGDLRAQGFSALARSEPNDGFVDVRLEYGLDRLHWGEAIYSGAKLAFSLSGLPAEELAAMQRALKNLPKEPAAAAMTRPALAAVLATHLPSLFLHDPRLALDRLEVSAPEGKLEAHLWVGAKGLTQEASERPGAWLERIIGGGDLSMPKSLLLDLLWRWRRQQTLQALRQRDPDTTRIPAELEPEVKSAASEQLNALIRDGWAAEQGGRVLSSFKLADALLTVNGKTFPIKGMGLP